MDAQSREVMNPAIFAGIICEENSGGGGQKMNPFLKIQFAGSKCVFNCWSVDHFQCVIGKLKDCLDTWLRCIGQSMKNSGLHQIAPTETMPKSFPKNQSACGTLSQVTL